MSDDPRPDEWRCCWHLSIDEHGICRECGQRAAIKLENMTAGEQALLKKHLDTEEKPVDKDISFAVEEFESACDLAIAALGGPNAYNLLQQRRERADIIWKLQPLEKRAQAHKPPVTLYPDRGERAVSQQEAAARDAKERLKEENARDEAAHIEGIKALNREYF